ncbi:type II toxin-antitoxin system HicA family toxin [Corynebacterium sp. AOP40-9SA-29]|uniref:type II toxin-antitoxin system HicA family toxin n=1 Tax=Corynebacterium sp. AOP40-9SA-29 TaxID=3457677 RepID=UPI00403337DE
MARPQKYKDVARFLRGAGWKMQRRGKGSHEVWVGPDGGRIVVPHHREVSAGIIGDIVRKVPGAPDNWK